MTGDVDSGHRAVDHVGTAFKEFVEHASDIFFVARDRAAGDNDRIAPLDTYLPVLTISHAVKCRPWLTLRTG